MNVCPIHVKMALLASTKPIALPVNAFPDTGLQRVFIYDMIMDMERPLEWMETIGVFTVQLQYRTNEPTFKDECSPYNWPMNIVKLNGRRYSRVTSALMSPLTWGSAATSNSTGLKLLWFLSTTIWYSSNLIPCLFLINFRFCPQGSHVRGGHWRMLRRSLPQRRLHR